MAAENIIILFFFLNFLRKLDLTFHMIHLADSLQYLSIM